MHRNIYGKPVNEIQRRDYDLNGASASSPGTTSATGTMTGLTSYLSLESDIIVTDQSVLLSCVTSEMLQKPDETWRVSLGKCAAGHHGHAKQAERV